jgi:transcriptional regulator with XRE-family HTH domain
LNAVDQEMRVRVGARLRQERLRRGLTIDQVATSSDLTKGFVSQLERGETSASLASLTRLAATLGLELSRLFERPSASLGVLRKEEKFPVYTGGEGVTDYQITPANERRVQLFDTRAEPGGSAGDELYTLDGDVVVAYVLSGQLEFRFADETVLLQEGDSITYVSTQAHTWANPSASEGTHFLFFCAPAAV